jgi:hypothetical protein
MIYGKKFLKKYLIQVYLFVCLLFLIRAFDLKAFLFDFEFYTPIMTWLKRLVHPIIFLLVCAFFFLKKKVGIIIFELYLFALISSFIGFYSSTENSTYSSNVIMDSIIIISYVLMIFSINYLKFSYISENTKIWVLIGAFFQSVTILYLFYK